MSRRPVRSAGRGGRHRLPVNLGPPFPAEWGL